MGYKDNQKTEFKQNTDGPYRKITGFWRKVKKDKKGKDMVYFKSGRINLEGFENMQAFGDKTIFIILPNRKSKRTGRHANAPDYHLVAVEDLGELKQEVWWENIKK